MSKKILGCVLFLSVFFTVPIFGYSYKINNVSYDIKGVTMKSAIKRRIPVNTSAVFENEESLLAYINNLRNSFLNSSYFDEAEITYSASSPENDLCYVSLLIKLKDTAHLLPLPFFKYTSSGGLTLKIKVFDNNFLGTLNPMDCSLNFSITNDDEGKTIYEPGIDINYSYPFKIGKLNLSWNNNYSTTYTIGNNSPEWSLNTGISSSYPLNFATLCVSATQGFVRNFDYRATNDEAYLSENLNISLPINLIRIPNYNYITFTPYVNFNYKFDPFKPEDGYSGFKNTDLMGPVLSTGFNVGYSYVTWNNFFRDGISISVGPAFSYNFASITEKNVTKFTLSISTSVNAFKAFEYMGINARFLGFANFLNGTTKFDGYLRGIMDNTTSAYNRGYYEAESPFALIFNIDMPISFLKTNFTKNKLRHYNFEVQISPFIDIALMKTEKHRHGIERYFDLRDGFYAAGVEVLVFPLKWRNVQVRASLGFDVGNLFFGNLTESIWRDRIISRSFELYIGMGLHY